MRLKASAGFINASALGMSCGPALPLYFKPSLRSSKSHSMKTRYQDGNGFSLAFLSGLVIVVFKEPNVNEKLNSIHRNDNNGPQTYILENGVTQPLLLNLVERQHDEDEEQEFELSEEVLEESCKRVVSIVSA